MARTGKSIWGIVVLLVCGSLVAQAGGAPALSVTVTGIKPGGAIPGEFAFCIPAKQGHVTFGPNKNPAIAWSTGPAGTKSYAIIMVDPDVPSVFVDANKEGKTISASLTRMDFYHWILVDIPATVTRIPAGADSNGVIPRGKAPGPTQNGVRGVNDYGMAFTGDAKMAGNYGGYDGPCPPWNDEIAHHYHFAVYALNVPKLDLPGKFTGAEAMKAMAAHVLAKGEVVGVYTLNPDVAKKMGIQ